MTNVSPLHRPPKSHHDPQVVAVAGEIRGMLAKYRIPVYKLPELAPGSATSRGYWQRRVSGEIPFDIADLSILARILEMPLAVLLAQVTPRGPETGPTPAPIGGGRYFLLPEVDSNHQPAGSRPAAPARGAEGDANVIDLHRERVRRTQRDLLNAADGR